MKMGKLVKTGVISEGVGEGEGANDGEEVGCDVGDGVGLVEGDGVGLVEGEGVGKVVGDGVGLVEGEGVGATVEAEGVSVSSATKIRLFPLPSESLTMSNL